jgi:hypothetical protein
LVVTSLLGYLEWGGGNSMFLFQGELEVLAKLYHDPIAVAHPFTLLPLIGQILLLVSLFRKDPGKVITFIGLACVSLLLLLMFFIGVISLNYKILFSTLPFILMAILTVREGIRK